ncbi:hypothetical protein UlMin_019670 [Ulmus minor]
MGKKLYSRLPPTHSRPRHITHAGTARTGLAPPRPPESQIYNVIFANGFEDFIEGTSIYLKKQLNSGEINPTFVAWRRQHRTILNWIYSSLTPSIMAQIIGHTSSHSVWVALEKIFSSSFRARIMQLRLELQTIKKGSMSMIDYIMKIEGVVDNLAAIGEPVSDQDQIMNLLGGLGVDYNAVVTTDSLKQFIACCCL